MGVEGSLDESRVIITIDGPAGTGKSTVAHLLAERLGLEYLDTGAMYRAAALTALESGIEPDDGVGIAEAIRKNGMRFDWAQDPPVLMLGERDISLRIRDMDVSGIVSIVAAESDVRKALVEQQRRIANDRPRLVTEGRDQGSVVFPDAPVRFYLDADVAVRAQRRLLQLAEAGKKVEEEAVIHDIMERDRIDSTREDGPLVRPDGAITVDTGDLSIEQVVSLLDATARSELAGAGHTA